MKLSMAAELAVRGILVLANDRGDKPLPLDEICRRRELPRQYLAKIFAMLSRAGLVNPVRGKGGGHVLARSPEQISLLDVIEAVEGPFALNLCQHSPPRCDEEDCPVRPVWTELQNHVTSVLGSQSLRNLMSNGNGHGGNGDGHGHARASSDTEPVTGRASRQERTN
jgi:Rrf2 family protein